MFSLTQIPELVYQFDFFSGVSDPEEVFGKFKVQKVTTERLFYLKNNTEEEKKHLESDQNLMLSEIEAHKFAQVKDKEE